MTNLAQQTENEVRPKRRFGPEGLKAHTIIFIIIVTNIFYIYYHHLLLLLSFIFIPQTELALWGSGALKGL